MHPGRRLQHVIEREFTAVNDGRRQQPVPDHNDDDGNGAEEINVTVAGLGRAFGKRLYRGPGPYRFAIP